MKRVARCGRERLTFAGRAWSEAKLLRLAYAYEQASDALRPPPGLPAL